MTGTELLLWAKGPGFMIALAVFVFGISLRLIETIALGRKTDLSTPKGETAGPGVRNMWRRFLPSHGMLSRSPAVHIGGYIFHAGFFIALLFFVPHILLIENALGFGWPGLPNGIVDGITLLTLLAMVVVLVARFRDPVKRMLTTFEDILTWVITFLPMLTGYMAVNRLFYDYETILALHVLSVELLMILFPFIKMMHAITWAFARYYTGAMAGRKGAHS